MLRLERGPWGCANERRGRREGAERLSIRRDGGLERRQRPAESGLRVGRTRGRREAGAEPREKRAPREKRGQERRRDAEAFGAAPARGRFEKWEKEMVPSRTSRGSAREKAATDRKGWVQGEGVQGGGVEGGEEKGEKKGAGKRGKGSETRRKDRGHQRVCVVGRAWGGAARDVASFLHSRLGSALPQPFTALWPFCVRWRLPTRLPG